MRTYDAFYLRPTNGRADDQVRRNHSAQYISQIVNDLKTGPQGKGAVALWLDIGTVAHFRNLVVSK